MVTYKTLMQQDRGWGLVCQMSVAPLVAGTLEWLIAVCAFWFIGAHYLAPWTWLAHLAAAYPLGGPAMWLRVGALAWAGWAFMRSGMDWATLAVFLWILLIPALTQLPHRWGGWAGRTAAYGLAFWFLLQMDHIAGLIGLVGLLLVLL